MPLKPGICGIANLDGSPIDADSLSAMGHNLYGHGSRQSLDGSWYRFLQHGYNTTGREGISVVSDGDVRMCFEGRIDNGKGMQSRLGLSGDVNYAAMLREGYGRMGTDLFKEMSGAYSCILIDTRRKTVRLLRDPMALRPAYYATDDISVLTGSDVQQILASGKIKPEISEKKLLETFSPMYLIDEGWSDAEATMFEGIRAVPYGSYVEWQNGQPPRIARYWHPPERLQTGWVSPEECAEQFRGLYSTVIAEHLDTPLGIGAELSGGVDSGCNVSIAAQQLGRTGRDFHAYTAVFGSQSTAERSRAQAIHDRYSNVTGHFVQCDEQIHHLEHGKFHDYRTTAHGCRMNLPETYVHLCRLAHEHGARIMISGEGADWYLEGTDQIWDSLIKRGNISELLRCVNIIRSRSSFRRALSYLMKNAMPSLLPGKRGRLAYLRQYYESTVDSTIPDLFTEHFRSRLLETLTEQHKNLLDRRPLSCWSQTLEHELMFPSNHVWQGVPVEVEMRLPYLDRRVVEFGLAVPPEYKFRISSDNVSHYGCRKYLQRQGFKDIVPHEVLYSQQKEGYGIPVNKRIIGDLTPLIGEGMVLAEAGVIDPKKLGQVHDAFLSDPHNDEHEMIPWLDTALVTEQWLRAAREEYPSCRLPSYR